MTTNGKPSTALVLAGGKGERLRPLTNDRPKPMVEVNGKPILQHHLSWLSQQGITRAILCTGYLSEVISTYFDANPIKGMSIEYVKEETPLGRGGALRHAFENSFIEQEFVVATNGDILTNQSISEMFEFHAKAKVGITILLKDLVSPYGIVDLGEGDLVKGFREKPSLPFSFNAGVYIISSSLFPRFPSIGDHETTLFPDLAAESLIGGFKCNSYWQSVETQKDISEAERHLGLVSET
ncbi:MAG: hypothetical protein CL776_03700 [Chloroflexi bacterium]|nr:hypothetical protein [Chloroflexota bacterium]MBT17733.1 hypothetical protein [Dehalococcoidia bacterium]|tara:strand:+ start:1149 stop:1865 length:717 start_codon:yes stop_codon:yes gene_type:complete